MGSEAYLWAKFHGYSSYRFGAMRISYRQTDTVLVAIAEEAFRLIMADMRCGGH